MRTLRLPIVALGCAVALNACGLSMSPRLVMHPPGWQRGHGRMGGVTFWVDPKNPAQRYAATSRPAPNMTLKQAASLVTTDVVLRQPGAKYVSAMLFAACPGEAGLQRFLIAAQGKKPADRLSVAFTVWNGAENVVWYERPLGAPQEPGAMKALTTSVCTGQSG